MNVSPLGKGTMHERLEKALHEGDESYQRLLEEDFRDAGWMSPEVLRGMRESDDFYASLFALVQSPKLHDGRVVLLGDAGYATPGIGTSLAIMGGYVLAGELLKSSTDRDLTAASERYEAIMAPFVKRSQSTMLRSILGMVNPQTAWGLWTRNTFLSWVSWLRVPQIATAVTVWLGVTEKKLALPDYPWPA